ncbi:MAG: hypothetical protein ACREBD_19670 [Blastocatellia bacterium]
MIVKEPMLGIMFYLLACLLVVVLGTGLVELTRLDQSRPSSGGEQPLEGALRAGALEFEQHRERIVIEQPQAIVASHAAGGLALELTATVRNNTGRVIKGLEVRGTAVDRQGGAVSERVAVIIPTQQTAIEPNEAIKARLLLKDIRPEASHAGVRMEVTGVIFD